MGAFRFLGDDGQQREPPEPERASWSFVIGFAVFFLALGAFFALASAGVCR